MRNDDDIRDTFEQYGEIESIEIINKSEYAEGESTQYAIVTFTSSNSAYQAQEKVNIHSSNYVIRGYFPTPSSPPNEDEGAVGAASETTSSLSDLNDDCLLHVLRMCDIESLANCHDVCLRLRILVLIEKSHRNLEHITFRIAPTADMPRMIKLLPFIGPHVRTFNLRFQFSHKPANIIEILYYIGHHLKHNLENLSIDHVLLQMEMFQSTEFWSRLRTFKLRNYNYDFDYDINVRDSIPNLIKLKMTQNMVFELNSLGQWKHLENLSIHGNQFMIGGTFLRFCENNPQLKTLSIQSDDMDTVLVGIEHSLPNIEKLSLYNSFPSLTFSNLRFLRNLSNLTRLKLMLLENEHILDILNLVCDLKALTHLKIHYINEDGVEKLHEQHVTAIVKNLTKLKVLHLPQFDCLPNVYLEIVRMLPSLNEIGFELQNDMDVEFRHKLNAARSLAVNETKNRPLNIIFNPFVCRGSKYEKVLFKLEYIIIKQLFEGDHSIVFEFWIYYE